MKPRFRLLSTSLTAFLLALLIGCATVPIKKYYVVNYEPEPMANRRKQGPYPYTVRIKTFDIEEAYARPQIVYRKSPFELRYYFYNVWAVKPTAMITDMVEKHLTFANLVSHVVRRYDDATTKPDYEISGKIDALEEYDNEAVWFAHLALRIKVTRLSDNKTVYQRLFDSRKQVLTQEPEMVVRELSRIMDFIMTQAIRDLDATFAREYGISDEPAPSTRPLETQLGPGDDGE